VVPSHGLIVAVAMLVLFALGVPQLTNAQLAILLSLNALFMGTVMSVVQVTVQAVAGQNRLGAAAASVQFSRSVGAALGTAVVGAVLFAVLAALDPDAPGSSPVPWSTGRACWPPCRRRARRRSRPRSPPRSRPPS